MSNRGLVIWSLLAFALLWLSESAMAGSAVSQVPDTADLQVIVDAILLQPSCELGVQGQAVSSQQAVRTGQAIASDGLGRARLRFDGNMAATLYRDTCLNVAALNSPATRLRLFEGTLSVETTGATLILETPETRISAVGTVFIHYDARKKATWVIVKRGEATVSNASVEVTAAAGQQTWVESNQPPVPPAPARRDVVGLRFFSLDDLTNSAIKEVDFLPPLSTPNYLWAAILAVLVMVTIGVVAVLGGRRRAPEQSMAGLRPVLPAGYGGLIPVRRGVLAVGRGSDNALVLSDHSVSAHHARVILRPDGYYLEDLESANGTFIGEQRVMQQQLHNGDRIRVGHTELVFQIVGARSTPQPSPEAPGQPPAKPPTPALGKPTPHEAAAGSPAPQPVVHSQARIHVVQPSGAKALILLTDAAFTMGRHDDNDLVLNDVKASSHHARVIRQVDGYVIEDLGSTNGTFVNDQRITHQGLHGGERIRIGDSLLVLEVGQSEEVTP